MQLQHEQVPEYILKKSSSDVLMFTITYSEQIYSFVTTNIQNEKDLLLDINQNSFFNLDLFKITSISNVILYDKNIEFEYSYFNRYESLNKSYIICKDYNFLQKIYLCLKLIENTIKSSKEDIFLDVYKYMDLEKGLQEKLDYIMERDIINQSKYKENMNKERMIKDVNIENLIEQLDFYNESLLDEFEDAKYIYIQNELIKIIKQ